MIWSAATVPTIELALLGAGVVMLAWAGFGLRGRGLVAPRSNALGRDGRDLVLALVALAFAGALVVAFLVLFDTGRNILAPPDGARSGPNLGAGALIAAILGAPFVIWATILKHRQFDLQKDGQITDRISKAVEQLGAEKTVKRRRKKTALEITEPNIEVRIGALLSLERIAQDSVRNDAGRDHVRVMEILCAYIRHNAPASGAKATMQKTYGIFSPTRADLRPSTDPDTEGPEPFQQSFPPPRADVQLALEVLGRRSPEQRRHEARWGPQADPEADWIFDHPPRPPATDDPPAMEEYRDKLRAWRDRTRAYKGYRLDLRETNLRRANLSGLNFSGARMNGARMDWVKCHGSRLNCSQLSKAQMQHASVHHAELAGADFSDAYLDRAVIQDNRLDGAIFFHTQITMARFARTSIVDVNLISADLNGSLFRDMSLAVTSKLISDDFSDDLWQKVFSLTLKETFGDASVKLPAGISPPEHWPMSSSSRNKTFNLWLKWCGLETD
ncbi:pentapeptide repeat-containing protein [Phaeovulum vinaykumarii]|uniref:Pentapeptide repeat-containing protein n=1 Tax=Phaeovulum vinaykumarii TaxID=407234 RepID=A0A1N7L374_9RHOB|nr:pentapeptide repeat-containing protein [Phaeovulum vinaykumarii]SIS68120.1 Pentapeptide repeat-containing protein [Phaeovulum vinaykumarii]SOC00279.1 pentapeptide repeat protein [Phaeovulum vinaykumarii]